MIARKNLLRTVKKSFAQPGYALHAFRQRFRSYLSYHLRDDGYSACPETISLFLTYKCNLRCPMCGQWGDEGAFFDLPKETLRDRLSLDEIKGLVNDVAAFRPNITFFGGEPMLYKGWTEAVGHIKAHKMRCNIVTNGTLLDIYAKEIVRLGLDEIILSLDGIGSVHDRMRGVEGTFDRLSGGVKAILEEKRRTGRRAPIINVNCTIFEINYGHLDEIVDIAEEWGVNSINFHHLLFLSRSAVDRHNTFFLSRFGHTCPDWEGFVRDQLPQIDVEKLIATVNRLTHRASPVHVAFYPNFTPEEIRRWYTESEFTSTSYANRCMSLWMAVWIFPDGSVRPYHSMNFSPGNIREARFTGIWNNARYKDYRSVIKRIKRFPVCAKGCTELYRY